jgi:hypothetical protein
MKRAAELARFGGALASDNYDVEVCPGVSTTCRDPSQALIDVAQSKCPCFRCALLKRVWRKMRNSCDDSR